GLPAGGDLVLDLLVVHREVEDRVLGEVPLQRGVGLVGGVRLQLGVAAVDLGELAPGHALGGVGRRQGADRRACHGLGRAQAQQQVLAEVPAEVGRRQRVGVVRGLVDRAGLGVGGGVVPGAVLDDLRDLPVPGLGGGAGLDQAHAGVGVPALAGHLQLDV